MDDLLVIGHSSGARGQVTFAHKLLEIASAGGMQSRRVDISDLFPVDTPRDVLAQLTDLNIEAGLHGHVDTDPHGHPDALAAQRRLMAHGWPLPVVFMATSLDRQLGLAKLGFLGKAPTIAWYCPYEVQDKPGDRAYLRRATLVATNSSIGVRSLLGHGVAEHRIVVLPTPYPSAADRLFARAPTGAPAAERRVYLDGVATRMGKQVQIGPSTRVFGLVGRVSRRNNQAFVLRHFARIAPYLDDCVLLLKSPSSSGAVNGDADDDVNYSAEFCREAKAVWHAPWFLWDDSTDPYETLCERYIQIDVGISMAGAGQAAVEMASVGTPLLIADSPYNRSLFQDVGTFVPCPRFAHQRNHAYPDGAAFGASVLDHATLPTAQHCLLRQAIRRRAQARFSPTLFLRRLTLAVAAARAYIGDAGPDRDDMRLRLLAALDAARPYPGQPPSNDFTPADAVRLAW